MIFGINTTHDISKLSQVSSRYYDFEISLMVFMTNITTNHAIFSYTNVSKCFCFANSQITVVLNFFMILLSSLMSGEFYYRFKVTNRSTKIILLNKLYY